MDGAARGARVVLDKSLQPCQRWSPLLCSLCSGCLTDDPDMQKYEPLTAQLPPKSWCWELAVSFLRKSFFFFCLLENVDSPQLRFSQSVLLHWSPCCVIFSTELLEGKKGEKEREEALHFGIIKAHEKPQNEGLGLCCGSAWAKLPKLMSLSPGP